MKRTKIVATIGPASVRQGTLEAMMRAGMNVCRLNMSHGDYDWHFGAMQTIRRAAKKVGEPVAILLDLQGPKVRLGEVVAATAGQVSGKCQVVSGDKVIFTTGKSGNGKIPIAVPKFETYAKKGAHLLIADGTIECVVTAIKGNDIHATVTLGGEIGSHKGIAIAGVSLPLPALTEKDLHDVKWSKSQDIDFIALSFVKKAQDVKLLRNLIKDGSRAPVQIIVKIETREAVHNFDEILKETDGVMVARGDLGLAFSPEDVPLIQKDIIEKCRRVGKPVIVATEMLASMEKNPRPTRAEASDVANAVIDHTDATMLSSESATGKFPVETVAMMASIIEKTEMSRFDDVSLGGDVGHGTAEEQIAKVASVLAQITHATAIVAGSLSGQTARLLSRCRGEIALFVGSPYLRVVHQLNLSWGVRPFLMPLARNTDHLVDILLVQLKKRHSLKKGNKVIFVGSGKDGQSVVGMREV